MPKAFVVAAPASSSGKTLVTCGLLALMREKGYETAPFKIGPDYIDPGHLFRAAGRPCYNLDSWMLDEEALKRTFFRGMQQAEIGVVEGVMGLYDGIAGTLRGSTAEVAELLGLPVLLVFKAQGLGGTIAALAQGLVNYRPLPFLGVVVTGVGSPRHERMLRKPLEEAGLRVWGMIPRNEKLSLPSRHLGLVESREWPASFREELLRIMAENFDLETFLDSLPEVRVPARPRSGVSPRARIAVARDEAFSFYYRENLDLLEEAGAQIVYFSPLRDPLPRAQGYYFGGGYPELHLAGLTARADLWEDLRHRVKRGAVVLAECGGFMALCRGVRKDGAFHPLAGLVPAEVEFAGRLKALGYRKLKSQKENFLLPPGEEARGHEFRYSSLTQGLVCGFSAFDAEGRPVETFGVVEGNLFASYVHLHFGSHPGLARNFVEAAASVKP
ncbi:MAG: cobyrinate a,c-diamide synthase [Thermodesulfobacteria bacterium]|nr:cobyrinate a,c-diamide synthase [Thermodesulfobacteriota bacterium]